MFAEAARRLIIVDDVDDVADDPNPLEKRSGDRHSTAFGRGLDPKSQMGRSSTLLTGVAAVLVEAAVVEPVDPFGGGVICPHRRIVSTWWPPTTNSTMRCWWGKRQRCAVGCSSNCTGTECRSPKSAYH